LSPDFVAGLSVASEEITDHIVVQLGTGHPDLSGFQATVVDAKPLLHRGEVTYGKSQHHKAAFQIHPGDLADQQIVWSND
jgi:hypothetical protein